METVRPPPGAPLQQAAEIRAKVQDQTTRLLRRSPSSIHLY
jgi:hypothetical protein